MLSGWTGLLLYAACALLGLVPVVLGLRRIHLTGALLVPATLAQLA